MAMPMRFLFRRFIGRAWRLPLALVSMLVLAGWLAGSASAATTITVNTGRETALFCNSYTSTAQAGPCATPLAPPPGNAPPGWTGAPEQAPNYFSRIEGSSRQNGECSLRDAVDAASTGTQIGACNGTGGAPYTIILPARTYQVWDNLFVGKPITFRGPNAGIPGNSPDRHAEANILFKANPNAQAQVAMFWLDRRGTGVANSQGAGTVFDGVEMQADFTARCIAGRECETMAIVQPTRPPTVELGYTVTNSVVHNFTNAFYLGGTDTITRNKFYDMTVPPPPANVPAAGRTIYSDFVYESNGTYIAQNVFLPTQPRGQIMIQGDGNRGTVTNTTVNDNLFEQTGGPQGLVVPNTTGLTVTNNLFLNLHANANPGARNAIGLWLDRVDKFSVTGNTFWGWGPAINFTALGGGREGSSDGTIAFNRFYNNRDGIFAGPAAQPITNVTANDNWWGANGGPGSHGHRTEGPGYLNHGQPVNGVRSNPGGTPTIPGIAVDSWLHLRCHVPERIYTNVPARVSGDVVGMPTIDSSVDNPATRFPWFYDRQDPLMTAAATWGDVYGFTQDGQDGRVPNEGTAETNALLAGTLIATHTGEGEFSVDLDSERAVCPKHVFPGPDPEVDKRADSPTVSAGGLAGFRVTVGNRGRRAAHNWWVCDRLPRGMRLVSATVRMRRLGRMPCFVIRTLRRHQRVSFHITLRAAGDAGGTETNVEEVIPGPENGGPPTVPGDEGKPAGPPAEGQPPHYRPIGEGVADVTVTRRPPGFTG